MRIYRGVGNSAVGSMLGKYFPDICKWLDFQWWKERRWEQLILIKVAFVSNFAVFGYLIAGSLDVQSLEISELTVASAIVAMGATRQARSHCKASIGVGNSVKNVKDVVNVANQVAAWNKSTLPGSINVEELAKEMEQSN